MRIQTLDWDSALDHSATTAGFILYLIANYLYLWAKQVISHYDKERKIKKSVDLHDVIQEWSLKITYFTTLRWSRMNRYRLSLRPLPTTAPQAFQMSLFTWMSDLVLSTKISTIQGDPIQCCHCHPKHIYSKKWCACMATVIIIII